MERLVYNETTHIILEEGIEKEWFYWRYQDSAYGGIIPVDHQSHERTACGKNDAEHIENGCSCYDNPYQLMEYLSDENHDLDKVDVILFTGEHCGYGFDEEDIVKVTEEADIFYSISLREFYKFCKEADIYFFGDKNLKETYALWHGEQVL